MNRNRINVQLLHCYNIYKSISYVHGNELSSAENDVVVFASSTGSQYCLEDKSWGKGAFTRVIVEGISGRAACKGNKITVNILDLYISERAKELNRGRQPTTTAKPS